MKWLRLANITLAPAFVLLLCAELTTAVSFGSEATRVINADGHTELTLTKSSSDIVRISISQMKVADSFPYKGALLWGGDVDELPKAVLISLEIHERNESVFVPLSVYSDLGDVMLASLSASPQGFVLTLHGGNTATGYDATLVFSRGYLISRTVRLREFPKERVETTTYSFPKRG